MGKKISGRSCYLKKLLKQVAAAKSRQSCPTLCDPIDGSPPGSPVPGILQARTLEWVAISFSNAWKWKGKSEVAQPCPTLSDPMDCSLPGSSVHGIFQARVLEWGAIAFSVEVSKVELLAFFVCLFCTIIFKWMEIALQCFVGFCHTSTWINHR